VPRKKAKRPLLIGVSMKILGGSPGGGKEAGDEKEEEWKQTDGDSLLPGYRAATTLGQGRHQARVGGEGGKGGRKQEIDDRKGPKNRATLSNICRGPVGSRRRSEAA